MDRQYCVYIVTNKNNTTLYSGVTSNLPQRIYQHKAKLVDGFSKKYNLQDQDWRKQRPWYKPTK